LRSNFETRLNLIEDEHDEHEQDEHVGWEERNQDASDAEREKESNDTWRFRPGAS
jgi:hypothetical protein